MDSAKEREDPTFVQDLKNSKPSVIAAAQHFRAQGYRVEIPKTRIRPDISQAERYSDRHDLVVNGYPVEVKQLLNKACRQWTSRGTYPYRSILVDSEYRWLHSDPKPVLYLIVNRALTVAWQVRTACAGCWIAEDRTFIQKGSGIPKTQRFMFCPVEYAEHVTLLKQRTRPMDEKYVELNEGDQENRPACPQCGRIITDGMTFVPACRGRHCPANPGGEEEDPSLVKA